MPMQKLLKSIIGLIPPVHYFTSLHLITFYEEVGMLLFYLMAAVWGAMVLLEDETNITTIVNANGPWEHNCCILS